MLAHTVCPGRHVSFNSPLLLSSALAEPEAFVYRLAADELNIVDEAQFAPGLFRILANLAAQTGATPTAAKSPRCLLVGATDASVFPGFAEVPGGRVAELALLPFSAAERHRSAANFLRRLLARKPSPRTFPPARLADEIGGATFPALALCPDVARTQWFDDYLSEVLQRDVQNVAGIRNPERMVPLLEALARRVGGLLNDAAVTKEAGLDAKTCGKYKAAARHTFLTFEIEPWDKPGLTGRRNVRQRKLYFMDTNLLCYVMRRDLGEVLEGDPATAARLFENFVATELVKQVGAILGTRIRHFNPSGGREVDFVLEDATGTAVGIDVKHKPVLSSGDFDSLRAMRGTLGIDFNRGIVLYSGVELAQFDDNLWAVPVNALWE
ncbi:MAG: DUF4143 domain-containing protein [Acidobacteriota bacterium]|jgi:predicted AAA+ superfamily ATPase|nr:DUF4143 domain-containing protein [Acidobacteriota bacterium]